MPDRQPLFAEPLKQKVFVALRKAGLLEPRVHFPWIMNLTDREAIKVLKELGQHIKPVAKEIGKKIGKSGLKITPLGLIADIGSRIGMKSKAVQDLINPEPLTYKRGGIVSLNQMTRPIGYR